MSERHDWHLLKATHKALYDEHWPKNLSLETVKHGRYLSSIFRLTVSLELESGTFQDSAAKHFNSLPAAVKSCPNFNTFSKETFRILKATVDIS